MEEVVPVDDGELSETLDAYSPRSPLSGGWERISDAVSASHDMERQSGLFAGFLVGDMGQLGASSPPSVLERR